MAIYKSALELVGNTPLVEVNNFSEKNKLQATELLSPCLKQ